MLKRKILAAVLPVVAAGTVVGSGFSAWYFADVLSSGSHSPEFGVEVTPGTENGGTFIAYWNVVNVENQIKTSDVARVVLDQGTYANKANEDAGIYFEYQKNGSGSWAHIDKIIVVYTNDAFSTLTDAGLKVGVDFSVEMDSGLNKFVQYKLSGTTMDNTFCSELVMTTSGDTTKISGAVEALKTTDSNYSANSWTWTFNFMNSDTYTTVDNYSNKLLRYYDPSTNGQVKEDESLTGTKYGKPNSEANRAEMENQLSGKKLTFKASYRIK